MRNLGGMMKKVQDMQARMEEITKKRLKPAGFRVLSVAGGLWATLSGGVVRLLI